VRIIGPFIEPAKAAAPVAVVAQPTRWAGPLRVTRISRNTPTVRTFRLAPLDGGDLPFTFLPGQFLNAEVAIDGVVHRRCYTIASSPAQTKYCELTVKRDQAGTVSRFLHDHASEGMQLRISGAAGRFTFTGTEADAIVLIGAGVGITPLMSVVRYLTDRKWPGEIHLILCARNEREIIFKQELTFLTESFPNIRMTTTLTQEESASWAGLRGRISAELLRRILPRSKSHRVHICGPTQMAGDVTRMLLDIGVMADQIRSEAFGGTAPTAKTNGQTIGAVTFTNSGKCAPVGTGQTILDAACSADVSIDHGCRAGVCGRCKVRLLSGDVEMAPGDSLSSCERTSGLILACQAKPLGNVAIEA
jgi:ferredoxin-NADP reductase